MSLKKPKANDDLNSDASQSEENKVRQDAAKTKKKIAVKPVVSESAEKKPVKKDAPDRKSSCRERVYVLV